MSCCSKTTTGLIAAIIGAAGIVAYKTPGHTAVAAASALVASLVVLLTTRTVCGTSDSKKRSLDVALSADEWRDFPLHSKTQISHNTAVYRFALPSPDMTFGLPIGQHISIKARINDKDVQRSYTPVSSNDLKGYFDLLIKSYPTGNISKLVAELEIGETISVKGPKGQFKYTPNMVRAIGMIAGGTGITPMFQVIQAVLANPEDNTQLRLIFANVNEEDILMKAELDALVAAHPDQFAVYYVLNNPPAGWTGGVGFVTKDIVAQHLPGAAKDVKVLLCGPPPMVKALTGYAEELGFDKAQTISKANDQVFKF
ncbi:NADH-cytochrome b5 reductase [Allomyces javanicus]|nr:NADH-cytochrome b5 reductase [Allomyces javanicus]